MTVATSSHTSVGRSDTWKARQVSPAAAWCSCSLGDKERWLLLQNAVKNGGSCPKAAVAIPAPPLASGGGGSSGLDSSPGCVSPLPMAGHSSNQPLIPREAEFNWATLLEALDPVLGNPHSSTVLGRGNQLLSSLSSGLPRNSFPYKSHLAFQHGALLTETTILSMLQ